MAGDSPTRKHASMAPGQRYGRLVAIARIGCNRWGGAVWRFTCDCGQSHEASAGNVRKGGTKSCGCHRVDQMAAVGRTNLTHGMFGTPEYQAWANMKDRCGNPNNCCFEDYGGRGVLVCRRWSEFECFYADMGPRPSSEHSLDRIDNDGNYEPGNCRWATRKEQNRNQRRSHLVTYKGRAMTLAQACEEAGVDYDLTYARINTANWSVERALAARCDELAPADTLSPA